MGDEISKRWARNKLQKLRSDEVDGLLLKYFVLKPKGADWHAEASRAGMIAYAEIARRHNPVFADELLDWAKKEQSEANKG